MNDYGRLVLRLNPLTALGAGIVFAFNGYAFAHTGLRWSPLRGSLALANLLAPHRAVEGGFAWAWLGPPTLALVVLAVQPYTTPLRARP